MRQINIMAFTIAFLLGANSPFACEKTDSGCAMDKKQWIDMFGSILVGAFCKKESSFLKCYEMDQSQCIKITLEVTDECAADIGERMPQFIHKSDSATWGKEIGGCAGDKLTDRVKLRAGMSESCVTQQP